MPCCLDCLNFKYKKGHNEAYCTKNMILDEKGKVKQFKDNYWSCVISDNNEPKFTWRSLVVRGRKTKLLNPKECLEFDSLDGEAEDAPVMQEVQ